MTALPVPHWTHLHWTHLLSAVGGAVFGYVAKAFEIWKLIRGPRITVGALFTSLPEKGHKITITNHSEKPAMFQYWAVMYADRFPWIWPRGVEHAFEPEFDDTHIRIDAHDRFEMEFTDDRYFAWPEQGRRLYLKLRPDGEKRVRYFNLTN